MSDEVFFLTGGQGFFGAWIARRLLDEGQRFALYDLERSNHILAQVLGPEELAGLERHEGDVADADALRAAVEASGATRILHLAGLMVPACRENPILGARVNVLGTLAVFEAAKASGGRVKSVVYASSSAVAGPPEDYEGLIADGAQHFPRTHYGVFKGAGEGNARIYAAEDGIPSVGLRPLSVYGVGRELGITSGPTVAIKAAVRGEPYTIPFTGMTGFNYAEDIAEIFVRSALAAKEGAVALNLAGAKHDVAEFIAAIEAAVPSARGAIRAEGGSLPVAWDFDESGLDRLLGTVPRTDIAEGVRRTAERYRQLLG